ncbi:FAS-associated death domain protein [Parambassis ranga]|uniref:FAS-associated death domain protein n=1 Tax=Parambassis ranga TaxID=210632 RepID=A0A6P7IAH2_9TELE|nr:FAS-associated death domain protein-like [Parambassis ranga]
MSSLKFNAVLLEISNNLSQSQLDNIKWLVRDVIGKRDQEQISTGLKLFQVLTERGKVSAQNTDYLSELLRQIHRQDLSDKLNQFEGESPDSVLSEEERDKLELATEVIAENLGKTWRKLGRRLGLTDVKLESISKRHPTDLEETTRELLKEWRKSKGAQARTEDLIAGLRACQNNMTADKLEDRLVAAGYR